MYYEQKNHVKSKIPYFCCGTAEHREVFIPFGNLPDYCPLEIIESEGTE